MVVTGVILVAQDHLLAEVRLLGFVGMLALLVASLAAGWLLGGPGSDSRKTLALTTSLRNVGVNLQPRWTERRFTAGSRRTSPFRRR
jgi:hypothetical protein